MGVLRWMEHKVFLGEVLRDYGVLGERRVGFAKMKISMLLCRRKEQVRLVVRETGVAPFGISANYSLIELTPENVKRLSEIVSDIDSYMKERSLI